MKRRGLHAYSNEALVAIQLFLSHVVLPDFRARYLDFIARPKSRQKFLNTLHHELYLRLDPAKRIDSLAPELLRVPGYLFSPYNHDCFGDAVDTLAKFLSSEKECFLLLTTDGKVGIHGPEARLGNRITYMI